jgi:hypothetical protein
MFVSSHRSRIISCLAALPLMVFAGCEAIPVSLHPLSDEQTSQFDPELIGVWSVIQEPEAMDPKPVPAPAEATPEKSTDKPAEAAPPEHPPQFAIGRLAGKENVHELVSMRLNDNEVEVTRMPFMATRLGTRRYLSMRMDEGDSKDYVLIRYEPRGEKLILGYMLDREFISQAIGNGTLKGVVKKGAPADPNDPNSEARKDSIRITAEPKELRTFLDKHADKAFLKQPTWRLERAAN